MFFFFSVFQDGNSCHPLFLDQSHHSEADIVDVSELHCNSVALEYASQENKFFVFSQTAKGYYNQPLKKYIPSSLTLPITSNPSTQFKGVFPNPSYNLIMQSGDRHSNSCPELQEGTHMENSSNGYHPQRNTDTFTVNQTAEDPESPVSCVSTYILLPQAAPQSCCMHSQYSE